MTGKIKLFCVTPSPNNSSPATMRLEVSGTNVPITDDCGGFKQFLQLLSQTPALDGEASGAACSGAAPSGVDNCILFLHSPVDLAPMEKGRIDIGAITLQSAHNGSYVVRTNSMMMTALSWTGGQLVLKPDAPNQIGLLVQPRDELPSDPAGPVVTESSIVFPSIVAVKGNNQMCAVFDHGGGPIVQNRGFEFTEPNGGDFGVVVNWNGHGFLGNPLDVWGAHAQKYGCVDIGHGRSLIGGGNMIRAIVAPEPGSGTGLDYWGHDDIIDLQILPGDTGNGGRGITLENGSSGMQCRIGQNVAVTPILNGTGSGHPKANVINGVAYQN